LKTLCLRVKNENVMRYILFCIIIKMQLLSKIKRPKNYWKKSNLWILEVLAILSSLLSFVLQLRWPTLVRSIPGQKKIKGGTLCVWNRKFLFLLWKVLMHEKSLLERIFISIFSSVNKFSIICNEIIKFTRSHGIINFSAYLCFDHFYT
jgi:hypothetical protein